MYFEFRFGGYDFLDAHFRARFYFWFNTNYPDFYFSELNEILPKD